MKKTLTIAAALLAAATTWRTAPPPCLDPARRRWLQALAIRLSRMLYGASITIVDAKA